MSWVCMIPLWVYSSYPTHIFCLRSMQWRRLLHDSTLSTLMLNQTRGVDSPLISSLIYLFIMTPSFTFLKAVIHHYLICMLSTRPKMIHLLIYMIMIRRAKVRTTHPPLLLPVPGPCQFIPILVQMIYLSVPSQTAKTSEFLLLVWTSQNLTFLFQNYGNFRTNWSLYYSAAWFAISNPLFLCDHFQRCCSYNLMGQGGCHCHGTHNADPDLAKIFPWFSQALPEQSSLDTTVSFTPQDEVICTRTKLGFPSDMTMFKTTIPRSGDSQAYPIIFPQPDFISTNLFK